MTENTGAPCGLPLRAHSYLCLRLSLYFSPLCGVITACPTPQETSCLHLRGLLAVTSGWVGWRGHTHFPPPPPFAVATSAKHLLRAMCCIDAELKRFQSNVC